MAEQIVQEGDQVVLDVNGEKLTFVQKLKGARCDPGHDGVAVVSLQYLSMHREGLEQHS